jgi:hypothetical protein
LVGNGGSGCIKVERWRSATLPPVSKGTSPSLSKPEALRALKQKREAIPAAEAAVGELRGLSIPADKPNAVMLRTWVDSEALGLEFGCVLPEGGEDFVFQRFGVSLADCCAGSVRGSSLAHSSLWRRDEWGTRTCGVADQMSGPPVQVSPLRGYASSVEMTVGCKSFIGS